MCVAFSSARALSGGVSDDPIDALGARQHGLVTRHQLLGLGLADHQVDHALKTGVLHGVRRGVFRLSGSPPTQDQAWLAAVLAAPDGAVLSHLSAAAAWGISGFEVPNGVDLLTAGTRPAMSGVRAHKTIWLPDDDRSRVRRIPATTVARTLIDVCGALSFPRYERAVDDALRRKLLRLPKLVRTFERIPASGRRKRRPAERVIDERVPGFNPGGSPAELDVLKILKRAGIDPLPEQQYRVVVEGHVHFLDYAWPETRQALEYDGVDFHSMVTDIHRGHDRTRRLQRAGWTLWPVTKRTTESEIVAVGLDATRG